MNQLIFLLSLLSVSSFAIADDYQYPNIVWEDTSKRIDILCEDGDVVTAKVEMETRETKDSIGFSNMMLKYRCGFQVLSTRAVFHPTSETMDHICPLLTGNSDSKLEEYRNSGTNWLGADSITIDSDGIAMVTDGLNAGDLSLVYCTK